MRCSFGSVWQPHWCKNLSCSSCIRSAQAPWTDSRRSTGLALYRCPSPPRALLPGESSINGGLKVTSPLLRLQSTEFTIPSNTRYVLCAPAGEGRVGGHHRPGEYVRRRIVKAYRSHIKSIASDGTDSHHIFTHKLPSGREKIVCTKLKV